MPNMFKHKIKSLFPSNILFYSIDTYSQNYSVSLYIKTALQIRLQEQRTVSNILMLPVDNSWVTYFFRWSPSFSQPIYSYIGVTCFFMQVCRIMKTKKKRCFNIKLLKQFYQLACCGSSTDLLRSCIVANSLSTKL